MPSVITDYLDSVWNQILDFMSKVIIPDWNALVGLIPLALLVLVVGPLLTLLLAVWFFYAVLKPRTRVSFDDGPRAAPRDEAGAPVLPRGEPYSAATAMIYPPGTIRDESGELLVVICPMCGLGRSAELDTCGNCGLVLKVVPRARTLRRAGPPPGGAAVA
jgi:hypothetical protein